MQHAVKSSRMDVVDECFFLGKIALRVRALQAAEMTLSWFQRYTDGKPTFHRRANLSSFSTICNHFGEIAAWNRKSLTMIKQNWRFFGKRPHTGKFLQMFSKRTHADTEARLVCKFREIWPTESRWNRVGRVGKLRVGFRYGVCRPGEWLWVDSNGKMETRHPVERLFGNELPSICNHCGVMADCRKTWKNFAIFLRFSEKWPLRKNYRNSVRTEFITTPINVLCSNFVKFGRREMGKIVRCLHLTKKTKIRLALQLSLLRGSRPKSVRANRDNVLRVLQISSKSVYVRRS